MRMNRAAGMMMSSFAMTLVALSAHAQPSRADIGKREYQAKCAVCHGVKATGDGPYRQFLKRAPSDLTLLARKSGGVFPHDTVVAIIDGRREVAAHGPREMPVWGSEYGTEFLVGKVDSPHTPETYIRARVLALVEYLLSLQKRQ